MPITNSEPGPSEWDLPPQREDDAAPHRSAKWVWIVGGIETILFGCCSIFLALTASVPLDELEKMADPAQFEMIRQAHPMLRTVAITTFVLGFVPGVAYLILGFGIKAGQPLPMTIALVLTMMQCIVFGILLINNILSATQVGHPLGVTVNIVTLGSLVGILGYTTHLLWQVKQLTRTNMPVNDDPWNKP